MVDNCDLVTKLHVVEPEVAVTAITEISQSNLFQFILSELIRLKGE
jgi:hypothetical protein